MISFLENHLTPKKIRSYCFGLCLMTSWFFLLIFLYIQYLTMIVVKVSMIYIKLMSKVYSDVNCHSFIVEKQR